MGKRWLLVALGAVAIAIAGAIVLVLLELPRRVESAPPTATATPTAATTPSGSASPSPEPREYADPTCENIMGAGFPPPGAEAWVPTRIEDPDPLFADGIKCRWSEDPTVGTDVVLAYGWAPADSTAWDALVADHTADGEWFTESDERGHYLTTKPDYWVQDAEGYGATYFFTGEAIHYAQTKAEVAHVVGPPYR